MECIGSNKDSKTNINCNLQLMSAFQCDVLSMGNHASPTLKDGRIRLYKITLFFNYRYVFYGPQGVHIQYLVFKILIRPVKRNQLP